MVCKIIQEKRGWILIIEAILAILILFGFLFVTIARQASQARQFDKEEFFYSILSTLALKAEKNEMIRDYVAQSTPNIELIENLLTLELTKMGLKKIKLGVGVCNINEECEVTVEDAEEIYTTDVVIATKLDEYKRLKIFIWE